MKRTVGQYIIFAILIGLFIAVIHRFILPVLLGLLISLVFRPIYLFLFRKFGKRPHLAASVSTVLILIGVLLPLILIGISVAKDIGVLARSLREISQDPNFKNGSMLEVPAISNLYERINAFHAISRESFTRFAQSITASAGGFGANLLGGLAASVPRIFVSSLFFLVAFYFGLLDGPRLVGFLRENLPFSEKQNDELFRTTKKICEAVVLGALIAGIVQGTILGLGYWILGIPRPLLAVVVTMISSFIPLMGSAPAGIAGIVYLFVKGKIVSAIIMGAFLLVAALSDNVVKPWVLKGKTELHPMLGLMSVLGGLIAFGAAGLFLGPIITALTITIIQLQKRPRVKEPETHPSERVAQSK